jgi:hypothetical protein
MRCPPVFIVTVGQRVWVYSDNRPEPRHAEVKSVNTYGDVVVSWHDGTTHEVSDNEWLEPRTLRVNNR